MLASFRTYLDFFELKCGLFLFGLLSFLGPFILVSTVIHYFTDRGACVRWNFHQVKAKIIGNGDGFVGRDDTNLIPVRVYYSDLFCPYISIYIYSISSRPICTICTFRNSYAHTSLAIDCWCFNTMEQNQNIVTKISSNPTFLSITYDKSLVGSENWNI